MKVIPPATARRAAAPAATPPGRRPVLSTLGALLTTLMVASVATGVALSAEPAVSLADLERQERAAVQDLYAAEVALDAATTRAAEAERRAAAAAVAARRASRDAERVATSVAVLRGRADSTLRALYISGQSPDGIAVILGAATLDEALDALDGLTAIANSQRSLARRLYERSIVLERVAARADRARENADSTASRAGAESARVRVALADRSQTLASVRRRLADQKKRLARAEQTARAASARTEDVNSSAASATSDTSTQRSAPSSSETTTPPPASAATPPPGGSRTLEVVALAYHLPGTTASGLPVGVGIIAVDPRVIRLGTRVFVPGYGPAVAADTGSDIKGNIIDLWMPSTELALAWGRRTVTITIYG